MTEADTLHAAIERDVKTYSDTFVRANHEQDASLMREWIHLPAMIFAAESTRLLTSPEDVDAQYQAGIDALHGTDYANSTLSDFEITVLNAGTALVQCHCVRSKRDGSVLQEFEAGYLVVRNDDRWQVAALISRR